MNQDLYYTESEPFDVRVTRYDETSDVWFTLAISSEVSRVKLYLSEAQLREIVGKAATQLALVSYVDDIDAPPTQAPTFSELLKVGDWVSCGHAGQISYRVSEIVGTDPRGGFRFKTQDKWTSIGSCRNEPFKWIHQSDENSNWHWRIVTDPQAHYDAEKNAFSS